jgi:hypothetical protein
MLEDALQSVLMNSENLPHNIIQKSFLLELKERKKERKKNCSSIRY